MKRLTLFTRKLARSAVKEGFKGYVEVRIPHTDDDDPTNNIPTAVMLECVENTEFLYEDDPKNITMLRAHIIYPYGVLYSDDDFDYELKLYDKEWRLWTKKPTLKRRLSTKWQQWDEWDKRTDKDKGVIYKDCGEIDLT